MSGKARRTFPAPAEEAARLLESLGVKRARFNAGPREVRSPITGEIIGRIKKDNPRQVGRAV